MDFSSQDMIFLEERRDFGHDKTTEATRASRSKPSVGSKETMRTVTHRSAIVCSFCFALLTASGCVWKSTYDDAVADMEGAKAELQSTKAEQQRLSQQVKAMEPLTQEATREAESAATAVQQAKDEAEAERKLGEERLAKLTRAINQLAAQQHSLREALQREKSERPALQITADKYRAKLDDTEGFRTPTIPPPASQIPGPTGIPPFPPSPAPADLASAPTAAAPAAPAVTPPTPPAPPPIPKRPAEPADEGFFSALKGWLVSLWHSVFS